MDQLSCLSIASSVTLTPTATSPSKVSGCIRCSKRSPTSRTSRRTCNCPCREATRLRRAKRRGSSLAAAMRAH